MATAADLLTRLIAAGTPAELVAEVAMLAARAEAGAAPDPVADRRREWDKQYRRERRAAEKAALSGGSGGRRVDNADNADAAPSLDKESGFPTPLPKEIKPIPCVGIAPSHEANRSDELILSIWLGWIAAIAEQRRKRWRDMPPPVGVSGEQWQGFIDHRRAKGEKLTPRAYDLLCRKLAKHADDEWPPGRIVDHIVERSWLSFEPQWLQRTSEHRNGQRSHHDHRTGEPADPMVRAAAARIARQDPRRQAPVV